MEALRQKWRNCGEKPLVLVIAIGLMMSMFMSFYSVVGTPAMATSDQDGASDYSFYKLANTAAAAISTALSDSKDPDAMVSTYFGNISPAAAGGLLGYTSKDNNRGVWGMFTNALGMGVNTKNYSSLVGGDLIKKVGGQNGTFTSYFALGTGMAQLGLDKSDGGANLIGAGIRGFAGAIAQIAFQLASTVTVIFGFVIKILKFFNPFQFFNKASASVEYGAYVPDMAAVKGTSVFGLQASDVFAPIITMVSKYWNLLHAAGLVMAGITLGIIVIKFFMPGHYGRLEGIRKWVIQCFFVIGGIALLGGTYTKMLNWLEDITTNGNTAAVKVVASTFFDFENWAMHGMPVPSGVTFMYDYDAGVISMTNVDVQDVCLKMNAGTNGALSGLELNIGADPSDAYKNMISKVQTMYGRTKVNADGTVTIIKDNATPANATKWAISTISRYMSGNKIYSSSYESEWKKKYWGNSSVVQKLEDYVNMSDDVDSILSSNELTDKRWSVYNAMGVRNPFAPGSGNAESYGSFNGGSKIGNLENLASTTGYLASGNGTFNSSNIGNFSAMAVYNYLNTTFDQGSYTIYSSENASSDFVRDSHYAVNLVGGGWNSIVIFLLCVLLLLCYAVLGFFYAISIIMANITRGFRLIVAVPGAMLGSLQSIAKVVSYAVIMIVEIVATIFLYCLVAEVMFTMCTVVTTGFAEAVNDIVGGDVGVRTAFAPIVGIFTCVFLVWFTMRAISLRKPIVRTFEEMADNVVQKFVLGYQPGATGGVTGGGGMAPVAAGAAAGAGAGALASRVGPRKGVLGKLDKVAGISSANRAKQDAEAQVFLSQMGFGGGSSAVGEENALQQHSEMKKEAKRNYMKNKVEAGKKALVGGAEVAVGAATGNAVLAARGAQNIAQGGMDSMQAEKNLTAEQTMAARATALAMGSRVAANDTKTAAVAAANHKDIQKMDVVQEATGAATMAVGAAMAGQAASGMSQGNLAQSVDGGTATVTQRIGINGEVEEVPGIVAASPTKDGKGMMVSTNNGQFSMQYDQQTNQWVAGAGSENLPPELQTAQQTVLRNFNRNMQQQTTESGDTGSRAVVTGMDGQPVNVPIVGEQVSYEVAGGGQQRIVRTGDSSVVVETASGNQVPMVLDNNGGYQVPPAAMSNMTAEQQAEAQRITQHVNTVLAMDHNIQTEATGSGQMMHVDARGNMVPVTETTVNGRQITNLQMAEEVRQSGQAGSTPIPVTPTQAATTVSEMTQEERAIVNTLRSVQQQQTGQINGVTPQGSAQGGHTETTVEYTNAERMLFHNMQQITQNNGGHVAQPVAAPSMSINQEQQVDVNGNVVYRFNNTGASGQPQSGQPAIPQGGRQAMTVDQTQDVTLRTGYNVQQQGGGQPVIPQGGQSQVMDVPGQTITIRRNGVVNGVSGWSVQDAPQQPAPVIADAASETRSATRQMTQRILTQYNVEESRAGGGKVLSAPDRSGIIGFDDTVDTVTSRHTTRVDQQNVTQMMGGGGQQFIPQSQGGQMYVDGGVQQITSVGRTHVNMMGGQVTYTGLGQNGGSLRIPRGTTSQARVVNTVNVTEDTDVIGHGGSVRTSGFRGSMRGSVPQGETTFDSVTHQQHVQEDTVVTRSGGIKKSSGMSKTFREKGSGFGAGIGDGDDGMK